MTGIYTSSEAAIRARSCFLSSVLGDSNLQRDQAARVNRVARENLPVAQRATTSGASQNQFQSSRAWLDTAREAQVVIQEDVVPLIQRERGTPIEGGDIATAYLIERGSPADESITATDEAMLPIAYPLADDDDRPASEIACPVDLETVVTGTRIDAGGQDEEALAPASRGVSAESNRVITGLTPGFINKLTKKDANYQENQPTRMQRVRDRFFRKPARREEVAEARKTRYKVINEILTRATSDKEAKHLLISTGYGLEFREAKLKIYKRDGANAKASRQLLGNVMSQAQVRKSIIAMARDRISELPPEAARLLR